MLLLHPLVRLLFMLDFMPLEAAEVAEAQVQELLVRHHPLVGQEEEAEWVEQVAPNPVVLRLFLHIDTAGLEDHLYSLPVPPREALVNLELLEVEAEEPPLKLPSVPLLEVLGGLV